MPKFFDHYSASPGKEEGSWTVFYQDEPCSPGRGIIENIQTFDAAQAKSERLNNERTAHMSSLIGSRIIKQDSPATSNPKSSVKLTLVFDRDTMPE